MINDYIHVKVVNREGFLKQWRSFWSFSFFQCLSTKHAWWSEGSSFRDLLLQGEFSRDQGYLEWVLKPLTVCSHFILAWFGLHHKSLSTGFRADKMTISIPISTKLGFWRIRRKVGLHMAAQSQFVWWVKHFLFAIREAGLNIAMSRGL